MKPSRLPAFLRRALALAALTSLGSSPALAATWYWDTDSATSGAQQGAGTWAAGGTSWWDGAANVSWNNAAGNVAHFGSQTNAGITATADASRTITVSNTVNAAGLVFNATTENSYILSGGEIVLADGSTIDVRGSNSTDTATKRHRITSTILGNNINITRSTTTSLAMLRLFGNNAWTGTLSLSAGSNEGIFVEALNVGAINTLSTVSVGANASMILATGSTFTPAFTLNGSGAAARGAIRFDTTGAIVSGAVTLTGPSTINVNSGITGTISGPITQGGHTLTVTPSGGILILSGNNTLSSVNLSGGNLALSGNNTITGNIAVGAHSLSLSGTNTFTGAGKITLNGGSLTLGRPGSLGTGANPIVLNGDANTIVAMVGAGGFSETEYAALPTMATTGGGTAAFGMGALSDFTWDGALSGTRGFAKSGPGTLTLLGTRSDSGGIQIREGSLRIYQIGDGGQNSSIGSSPSTASSVLLSGGRLMYVGPAAQTDRLFTMSASSMIDSSGHGPLRFTNTGTIVHSGNSGRTLTLTGYAPGENRIASIIPNTSNNTAIGVTKQGTAAWTLAGTNTYTGTTRNNGGILTLDYSAGADPVSTGAVHLNAGEIRIKGTTGGTTETFSTFQLAINQHTAATLKFENRVNLTATTFTHGGSTQRNDLIDISSNPNNSFTITALNSNNAMRVVNGVLMANASTTTNGRANLILRDKDGTYGFPTLSGGTSGNLVKISASTADSNIVTYTNGATAVFNDNTKNYRITKGEYSASGIWDTAGNYENMLFNTITLDSTAPAVAFENEISLSLNTGRFSPGMGSGQNSGKGILITGNNNVTISNAEFFNSNTQPIWFHNYLEPNAKFKIEADFDQQFLIFGGTGFTEHVGFFQKTDNFFLHGSTVRLSRGQILFPSEGNFRVAEGGVLEVNADFFSLGLYPEWDQVDFAKPLRTTPAGGIAFYGDSGMSAYSTAAPTPSVPIPKRVVHFATYDISGVPSSQQLVWGADRFLTQPDSETDGDYTFKLSSSRANAMLELRNNINLNGRSRKIEVANGSADVDALLNGVLSGSDASGIIKSGAGTLQLGGQNTYKGETRVQDGTLMVGPGNLHPSSTIYIATSATGGAGKLHVTGDVAVAAVYIDGAAQPAGKVTKENVVLGGGSLYVGSALTPYQQWANNNSLSTGESAADYDADFDGVKNGIEYAVGTAPKGSTPSVLTQVAGAPASVRFNRATTPVRSDLTLYLEASPDLGAATWTVLATSTAGAAMTSSVGVSATVSESAGTVTVTDNRTHATGKVFYRLRAQIP
ncbi:autotransporter-associated beta strand repeat-containing protein [Luteolibacter sp. SL250]|uniref:autotransporter-associated beta strand repeat-containing protein n=1 Tax=Luteolibacter sp. SL250 TaxID=2995170 RepID=UPI002D1E3966|nr:autotransporter-associated beta strand repeat-containing protein [Luteolibacter sp. SL250]